MLSVATLALRHVTAPSLLRHGRISFSKRRERKVVDCCSALTVSMS